jgi:hypothetical protein
MAYYNVIKTFWPKGIREYIKTVVDLDALKVRLYFVVKRTDDLFSQDECERDGQLWGLMKDEIDPQVVLAEVKQEEGSYLCSCRYWSVLTRSQRGETG